MDSWVRGPHHPLRPGINDTCRFRARFSLKVPQMSFVNALPKAILHHVPSLVAHTSLDPQASQKQRPRAEPQALLREVLRAHFYCSIRFSCKKTPKNKKTKTDFHARPYHDQDVTEFWAKRAGLPPETSTWGQGEEHLDTLCLQRTNWNSNFLLLCLFYSVGDGTQTCAL
jgi:hypothetical protein